MTSLKTIQITKFPNKSIWGVTRSSTKRVRFKLLSEVTVACKINIEIISCKQLQDYHIIYVCFLFFVDKVFGPNVEHLGDPETHYVDTMNVFFVLNILGNNLKYNKVIQLPS